MSQRLSLLFKWGSYAVCIFILIFAFKVQRENVATKAQLDRFTTEEREVLSGVSHPILIRGFSVPISEHSKILDDTTGSAQFGRTVIMIYRGACGACATQMPAWKHFLNESRLNGISTWLVNTGEEDGKSAELISILRARHLPYRLSHVEAVLPFMLSTGIEVTPVTIVTLNKGSETTVEFAAPGLASRDQLDLIAHEISNADSRPTARIFPQAVGESVAAQ